MLTDLCKTPWPWFGGKTAAAPAVWAALGDVPHYVEPFAGSLAVLLRRPHPCNRTYHSETVNDLDGLLVNAWRAIQLRPQETAEAASWPVTEADLHARHIACVKWKTERDVERLMGDPTYCDPVVAGWWIWGQSSWIGSGWCTGTGAWTVGADGRITKQARNGAREPGVERQLPHISSDGQGVNRPQAREPGVNGQPAGDYSDHVAADYEATGGYHPMTMPEVRRWFSFLAARLRHVRIINGAWERAVTSGATQTIPVRQGHGPCGVFLDPPYADSAGRDSALYAHDSGDVAHAVREWAIGHGDDPMYRIVVAGFDGEHGDVWVRAGWREVEWFANGFLTGGMAHTGDGESQAHRDRLWLSPHCLGAATRGQMELW